MSIEEMTKAKLIDNLVEEILFKGSYPRVWHSDLDPSLWYHAYIQSYVERDVRLLKNIEDLVVFQNFIKLCAARIGTLINYADLSRDCGISIKTAKSWLSILEASFILYRLQPHHNNFGKRITKSPKLYFYDTGLACSLLGIENAKQVQTHYLKGNLFESFIISEFIKKRYNQGLRSNIYFFRDHKGIEVDLIIEKAEHLIPIEIKAGATFTSDWFKNLQYFCNLTNTPPKEAFVIYNGDRFEQRKSGFVSSWKQIGKILKQITL